MELTEAQKKSLKGQGFIAYKDGLHFSCRVIIPAGRMNAQETRKISDLCEKYGKGYFTLTQRLNVEIPWIRYQDLDNLQQELREVGLAIGGTGMRARPALTCKGSVCQMSFLAAEEVAKMIDERFYKGQYETMLPNKFRIVVSGCNNGCSKPHLGCIGLQGRSPNQVAVIIAGMYGQERVTGKELPGLYSISEALAIVEKAISYYRENGITGELFAGTVARIGFEKVRCFLTGLTPSDFSKL